MQAADLVQQPRIRMQWYGHVCNSLQLCAHAMVTGKFGTFACKLETLACIAVLCYTTLLLPEFDCRALQRVCALFFVSWKVVID